MRGKGTIRGKASAPFRLTSGRPAAAVRVVRGVRGMKGPSASSYVLYLQIYRSPR